VPKFADTKRSVSFKKSARPSVVEAHTVMNSTLGSSPETLEKSLKKKEEVEERIEKVKSDLKIKVDKIQK